MSTLRLSISGFTILDFERLPRPYFYRSQITESGVSELRPADTTLHWPGMPDPANTLTMTMKNTTVRFEVG